MKLRFPEGLVLGGPWGVRWSDVFRVSLVCVWEEGGCVCKALDAAPEIWQLFVSENKLCSNYTEQTRVEDKKALVSSMNIGNLIKQREVPASILTCMLRLHTHTPIACVDSRTYSFFTHLLAWNTLSTWITACPRNTSSPMSARCITVRISSLLPAG